MGTRWILGLNCAHCGKLNDDVYYAPTCGFLNFACEHCGKENGIFENFEARKERNTEDDEDRTQVQ